MILPFEHVESSEQRGRAVALVIMGHRPAAAGLQRQAQLGAVERLDLRFLIEAEHDGVRRRVDIEPNDVACSDTGTRSSSAFSTRSRPRSRPAET